MKTFLLDIGVEIVVADDISAVPKSNTPMALRAMNRLNMLFRQKGEVWEMFRETAKNKVPDFFVFERNDWAMLNLILKIGSYSLNSFRVLGAFIRKWIDFGSKKQFSDWVLEAYGKNKPPAVFIEVDGYCDNVTFNKLLDIALTGSRVLVDIDYTAFSFYIEKGANVFRAIIINGSSNINKHIERGEIIAEARIIVR